MPIREESFRIGCGRYIQGRGYISKAGDEVRKLGNSPFVIGGKTALGIAGQKLEKSLSAVCNKYEFVVHTGTCNDQRAQELADVALSGGYDVIVGVGGGVICDFAKLCGGLATLKFTYETDADPGGKSEFRLCELGVFARIFDGTAELFRRAEKVLRIHTSLRMNTIFPSGKKCKREG